MVTFISRCFYSWLLLRQSRGGRVSWQPKSSLVMMINAQNQRPANVFAKKAKWQEPLASWLWGSYFSCPPPLTAQQLSPLQNHLESLAPRWLSGEQDHRASSLLMAVGQTMLRLRCLNFCFSKPDPIVVNKLSSSPLPFYHKVKIEFYLEVREVFHSLILWY